MTIFTSISDIPPLRYDIIMADPPWYFRNYSQKGEAKNPVAHYSCMTIDEIAELPIGQVAAPNCLLWLWATNPMLPHSLHVMSSWGFTFKTAGHWVKRTKNGKLSFGTGYILRSSGEPFLIGTIGKPKCAKNVRSIIDATAREHSRKPDEAYDAAERLVPDAINRLDLFSRQKRLGWDSFGNEVEKFDEHDYPSL